MPAPPELDRTQDMRFSLITPADMAEHSTHRVHNLGFLWCPLWHGLLRLRQDGELLGETTRGGQRPAQPNLCPDHLRVPLAQGSVSDLVGPLRQLDTPLRLRLRQQYTELGVDGCGLQTLRSPLALHDRECVLVGPLSLAHLAGAPIDAAQSHERVEPRLPSTLDQPLSKLSIAKRFIRAPKMAPHEVEQRDGRLVDESPVSSLECKRKPATKLGLGAFVIFAGERDGPSHDFERCLSMRARSRSCARLGQHPLGLIEVPHRTLDLSRVDPVSYTRCRRSVRDARRLESPSSPQPCPIFTEGRFLQARHNLVRDIDRRGIVSSQSVDDRVEPRAHAGVAFRL